MGSQSIWCCSRRRYSAISSTSYEYAVLRIKRQGYLAWRGLHLGSGFSLSLKYSKTVKLSGDIIGLNEDYDLTPTLARFLTINKDLIDESLYYVEERVSHYRRYHRKQCRLKSRTLSYKFLATIYDSPAHTEESLSCLNTETDQRVRILMASSQHVFASAHARLNAVGRSEATAWWYVFWVSIAFVTSKTTLTSFVRMIFGGETELQSLEWRNMRPISILIIPVPSHIGHSLELLSKPSWVREVFSIPSRNGETSSMLVF